MWLHSPDPEFREKVNVICRLYRKAPEVGVVLSIDEKTGMQAVERKHLDRPPRSGRFRRQEFEYRRHGTQALIAAPIAPGFGKPSTSARAGVSGSISRPSTPPG